MVSHGHFLQSPEPALCRKLFEHLLEVTAPKAVAAMKRYGKLKAALHMLSLNAARFGGDISDNAAALYDSESISLLVGFLLRSWPFCTMSRLDGIVSPSSRQL